MTAAVEADWRNSWRGRWRAERRRGTSTPLPRRRPGSAGRPARARAAREPPGERRRGGGPAGTLVAARRPGWDQARNSGGTTALDADTRPRRAQGIKERFSRPGGLAAVRTVAQSMLDGQRRVPRPRYPAASRLRQCPGHPARMGPGGQPGTGRAGPRAARVRRRGRRGRTSGGVVPCPDAHHTRGGGEPDERGQSRCRVSSCRCQPASRLGQQHCGQPLRVSEVNTPS